MPCRTMIDIGRRNDDHQQMATDQRATHQGQRGLSWLLVKRIIKAQVWQQSALQATPG